MPKAQQVAETPSGQIPIDFARARRDDGIERAGEHAGAAWARRARGYLLEFLATHHDAFLAEELRWFAEDRGLEYPPDGRAWGSVMRAARKDGFVRPVEDAHGRPVYAPAKSSNLSPKCLWRAA